VNISAPAIAAFANATLQLAALVALMIAGLAGEIDEDWRVTFALYSWPIPLATAVALLGLVTHPAMQGMRLSVWSGALLLGVFTWLMWVAATVGLSLLSHDSRPEAAIAVLLAPLPALVLAGMAATLLSLKLFTRFAVPTWFVALGMGIAPMALAAFFFAPFLYVAMLLLAAWWASIGFTFSQTPRAQTVMT